jgi:hypothetical protein
MNLKDQYALNNILSTNGLQLHVLCYDLQKPYRSRTSIVPIYRIERRFPTLQSVLDAVEEIDVWGIDPGEVNPAAFCRIERQKNRSSRGSTEGQDGAQDGAQESTNMNDVVVSPGITAHNLVISRTAIYSPVLSHRGKMDEMKACRPILAPGEKTTAKLWARADCDQDKNGVSLPSIKNIENLLLPKHHDSSDDLESTVRRLYLVRPLLQDFYSSDRVRRLD